MSGIGRKISWSILPTATSSGCRYPSSRVLHEHELVADLPRLEHVRPGADRVLRPERPGGLEHAVRRRPCPRRPCTSRAPCGLAIPNTDSASAPRKPPDLRRQHDHGRVRADGLAALVEALVGPRASRCGVREAAEDRVPVVGAPASVWSGPGKLYQRLKLKQTALALNGVPSWNFTPGRRLNVQLRPFFEVDQLVASWGTTTVRPGLRLTRPWKIRLIGRSDSPSETSGAVQDHRIGRGAEDERRRRLATGQGSSGRRHERQRRKGGHQAEFQLLPHLFSTLLLRFQSRTGIDSLKDGDTKEQLAPRPRLWDARARARL